MKIGVKDHKLKVRNENGNLEYDTRLIVPSSNFTSIFYQIGYKAIQNIFNKHKIYYKRFGIKEALQLKLQIEKLKLKRNISTSMKFDIKDFYSSVKINMI